MNTTAHRQTVSGPVLPAFLTRARFVWVAAGAAAVLIVVLLLGVIAQPSDIGISSSIVAPPNSAAANSPRNPAGAPVSPVVNPR